MKNEKQIDQYLNEIKEICDKYTQEKILIKQ